METRLIQRRLSVAATLLILLATACRDVPTASQFGNVRISVRKSGGIPNGSFALVVGAETRQIGTGEIAIINGISPGTYDVSLQVPENCEVMGTHVVTLMVVPGETVDLAFVTVCVSTGIEITTRTKGYDDGLGFELAVNGQSWLSIAANGSVVVEGLSAGMHTVAMRIGGEYCSLAGKPVVMVGVSNRAVTPVVFEITCATPTRSEKIAYEAETITGGARTTSIALVNPDGSRTIDLVYGHSPAWSPDGTRLAFSTVECSYYYGCSGDLVIEDPETRHMSTLVKGTAGFSPTWDPTGDAIAFVGCCEDRARSQLYLIRLDGSPAQNLPMFGVSEIHDPAWSPDGKRIAFGCVVASGNLDLCVVNRNGTGLARLTSDVAFEWHPAWSPDGRWIAFIATAGGPQPRQIAVMAADGTGIRILADGYDPAWSRDGAKLVFARDDGLYTIDAHGSNLKRLTTGHHHAPAWRP